MGLNFPRPRKRSTRVLLASTVALVGFAGVAFAQVTPAMADPTETLVAVGSDTIQDVYNQFGLDAGGNLVGSYNAVNPVTAASNEIITPVDGTASGALGTTPNAANPTGACSFQRPNGSGGGIEALQVATNPSTTYPGESALSGTAIPQPGCVDIARSSSGVAQQDNAGALVWVPFALDAVAGSTGLVSGTAGTNNGAAYSYTYTEYSTVGTTNIQNTVSVQPVTSAIALADDFSEVDLVNLFKNCLAVTITPAAGMPISTGAAVTYNPNTASGTQVQIDLYVPQLNSGTRNFWASTLGFSKTTLPSCVHDKIIGGPLASATGGVPVEEHNGTPEVSDPNGFGPFSIAQWISQRNGNDDRRHTVVLHELEGCTAITGNPATGTCTGTWQSPYSNGNPANGHLNTSFPITRDVYSVVSYARVTTASDPLDGLLNGPTSFVCSDTGEIAFYGFAAISNCGSVVNSLRGDN